MKAGDVFFNEYGFESSIISENAKKLNLAKDPEFMAVIMKYQQEAQKYTELKKQEVETAQQPDFMSDVQENDAALF